MKKNFVLTDEFKINLFGVKVFRIKCTRKIKYAEIGDLGGFIEKESNISGNAWVSGDAQVSGNAWVYSNALVSSSNDYCCFHSFGSINRTTTVFKTTTEIKISCGCFLGTISEFEFKVKQTHANTKFEREYMAIIEVIKIKFEL